MLLLSMILFFVDDDNSVWFHVLCLMFLVFFVSAVKKFCLRLPRTIPPTALRMGKQGTYCYYSNTFQLWQNSITNLLAFALLVHFAFWSHQQHSTLFSAVVGCRLSMKLEHEVAEGGVECRKNLFIQDECRFSALSQDCTTPYRPGNSSYPKDGRERAAMASLQPL